MTLLTELVVVCHGEAACDVAGIVGGDVGCAGLTDRGRQQARLLAHRLAAEHAEQPFRSLHTAPRLRVRQTADEIADRLGLAVQVEPDLREPDHAAADARRWDDVWSRFGGTLRRYPDRRPAAGAESWHDYLARVQSSLRALVAGDTVRRIILVGHRETVEAVHVLLLGLGRGASARTGFTVDPAGVARWRLEVDPYGHKVWKLAGHNDTRHLYA